MHIQTKIGAQRALFLAAIHHRGNCPFCWGRIKRRGDHCRCFSCGFEVRLSHGNQERILEKAVGL